MPDNVGPIKVVTNREDNVPGPHVHACYIDDVELFDRHLIPQRPQLNATCVWQIARNKPYYDDPGVE